MSCCGRTLDRIRETLKEMPYDPDLDEYTDKIWDIVTDYHNEMIRKTQVSDQREQERQVNE